MMVPMELAAMFGLDDEALFKELDSLGDLNGPVSSARAKLRDAALERKGLFSMHISEIDSCPLSYKPSKLKKHKLLGIVPTNLHVQVRCSFVLLFFLSLILLASLGNEMFYFWFFLTTM